MRFINIEKIQKLKTEIKKLEYEIWQEHRGAVFCGKCGATGNGVFFYPLYSSVGLICLDCEVKLHQ